jgi:hypothetical protein
VIVSSPFSFMHCNIICLERSFPPCNDTGGFPMGAGGKDSDAAAQHESFMA